jgi:sigma-E factor negative regulatory protein RseB
MASIAVVIAVLGSCAVLVVLVESPGAAGPGRSGLADKSGPARKSGLVPRQRAAVPSVLAPASRLGVELMTEAAAACESVPFQGIEMDAWWGSAGEGASVLQVWHRPGDAILARSSGTAADPADERQLSPDDLSDSADVMTVTSPLLALMRANYVLTYSGRATVDGRPAQVIEVRRRTGGLAARFWLDAATKLPLRREVFDADARILSEDALIGLSVGASQLQGMPSADAQPWSGQLTTAGLAGLRVKGWPLPRAMPGGLALFRSTETSTKSGKVVELSYSDGLSVISVFVQRGELPRSMPGWRRIAARGSQVYAMDPDDRSLAWSGRGFVYTVISDASAATVDQAIMRFPHDSQPGFTERMGRGFRRIASWANPFG